MLKVGRRFRCEDIMRSSTNKFHGGIHGFTGLSDLQTHVIFKSISEYYSHIYVTYMYHLHVLMKGTMFSYPCVVHFSRNVWKLCEPQHDDPITDFG